jgi:phosphoesterase RecJ-like protein
MKFAFENLLLSIQDAQSIVLSTHRQCDGDGLGAEMALFHALKQIKKKVKIINVDKTAKKYRFLSPDEHILYFEEHPDTVIQADLVLIFDTNDERLLKPLYGAFLKSQAKIIFIDHHPRLQLGPAPTIPSWIDTSAASTGEMAYRIIKGLQIPLDVDIARALYTSITFDTQLFRYIRNSPVSHEIAAELVRLPIQPQVIHKHLFGEQTVSKMKLLAQALGQIEYFDDGRVASLKLHSEDLRKNNLDPDDARDVIDFLMNIEILEAAVLFREDGPSLYKLSLRSKGRLEVLDIAETLGGGGHLYASGAQVKGKYETLRDQVVAHLIRSLNK